MKVEEKSGNRDKMGKNVKSGKFGGSGLASQCWPTRESYTKSWRCDANSRAETEISLFCTENNGQLVDCLLGTLGYELDILKCVGGSRNIPKLIK